MEAGSMPGVIPMIWLLNGADTRAGAGLTSVMYTPGGKVVTFTVSEAEPFSLIVLPKWSMKFATARRVSVCNPGFWNCTEAWQPDDTMLSAGVIDHVRPLQSGAPP